MDFKLFVKQKAESYGKIKFSSSLQVVTAGIPEGSMLEPLLFLICVNDIAESVLSLTRLFANDSSLYFSGSSLDDIEGIMNHDLRILFSWASQWLVNFNPNKTEAKLFTLRNVDNLPSLIFNNTRYNLLIIINISELRLVVTANGTNMLKIFCSLP